MPYPGFPAKLGDYSWAQGEPEPEPRNMEDDADEIERHANTIEEDFGEYDDIGAAVEKLRQIANNIRAWARENEP